MIRRVPIINPVAKAMLQSRRRTQALPDKTKYNRKKDKENARKDIEVSHKESK
jgi:hypothetical protein